MPHHPHTPLRSSSKVPRLVLVWLAALTSVVLVAASPASAAPSDDDFDTPTVVGALPFTSTADSSGATWSQDDPGTCPNAGSRWFQYTADADTLLRIDAAGYSASVSVHVGSRGNLATVACSFQADQNPVVLPVTAGTTYHIMVAQCCFSDSDFQGAGTLTLSVRAITAPANDDFDQAIVIGQLPFSSVTNTLVATTAADDPLDCAGPGANTHTVWFELQNLPAGQLLLDTAGYQTVISVWTGTRGALTMVDCRGSELALDVQPNATYFVMVTSQFGTGGDLTFSVRQPRLLTGVTADKVGTVNRDGMVTIRGTVSCTEGPPIDVFVNLMVSQTFKRPPITITAGNSGGLTCQGSNTAFALSAQAFSGSLVSGPASVFIQVGYCDGFLVCTSPSTEQPKTTLKQVK